MMPPATGCPQGGWEHLVATPISQKLPLEALTLTTGNDHPKISQQTYFPS